MPRRLFVPLSLSFALVSSACSRAEPEIHQLTGPTMGSTYEVKWVGDVPLSRVREIVSNVLEEFDAAFSKWRNDSEILRCNAAATTEPFVGSPRFLAVLQQALDLAALTDGAFDPTVEPLLRLYREAKAAGRDLDESALTVAQTHVDYRKVAVEGGAVQRSEAGIELDLDGLVAGACLDALAVQLRAAGVDGFYLEVTGEVYCGGEKAPGLPWRIGVVDPRADLNGGDAALVTLPLRDRALCTSGDYRNAFVSKGRVVHHVFDPRTGRSAASSIVSASVVADSAAVADGLGTAMLVLGESGAAKVAGALAKKYRAGILLLIVDEEEGLRQVEFAWPTEER